VQFDLEDVTVGEVFETLLKSEKLTQKVEEGKIVITPLKREQS
jgi:hypothetical protein